jgi:hypothetical protein
MVLDMSAFVIPVIEGLGAQMAFTIESGVKINF